MTYTAEQLRAKARNLRELGRQLAADDCEAYADALEENARLKAERDTSVAVTERIKVALRIRGTGSYVEWAAYCRDALEKLERAEAELAALREQLAEERNLVEKLQRALMFWMPAIAGSGTEAGERAAADAYLLVGYAGPFEKSAEDRKWVRASVFARGEGEVIEAGDVIHSRGLPFRLVYDAEVEGANGDLSRNLCK